MRFGLQLETYTPDDGGNPFEPMRAVARLAEQRGFASVWYEDHFMFRAPDRPGGSVPQLECLTTLAAIAAATERVEIGMLVLGVPYRNPALVAKMLATLDVISGGRVIAGLGAGWHEEEFRAYGYPFPPVGERMEMLEEAVQIVDRLLRGQPASFTGKHFTITDALNDPPPMRQPRPPILIAGNGERRTLRLVARYAEMCNVYGSVEDVARKFAVLRQHCADVGRPDEAITRTMNYWTLTAPADEHAAKRARYPRAWAIHTPEETITALKRYEEAGVQYTIVKLLDASELQPVQLFADTVLPAFTRS
jgi:F420-dependent oxidoreductase-like protein